MLNPIPPDLRIQGPKSDSTAQVLTKRIRERFIGNFVLAECRSKARTGENFRQDIGDGVEGKAHPLRQIKAFGYLCGLMSG